MLSSKASAGVALAALVTVLSGCTRQVSYEAQIKPILETHCYACHRSGGQGYEQSGFLVDSYENLMKGTKFGEVIVPGVGITSTLYLLVAGKTHYSIRMPYRRRSLSDDEIELIKRWIDQGAKNN